jgi:hypothetical protein
MAPCSHNSDATAAVSTPEPRRNTAATEGASIVRPHGALRPPQAPMRCESLFRTQSYLMQISTLSLDLKGPEREAHHSPQSSGEVKNAKCLVQFRDTLTYTLPSPTARPCNVTMPSFISCKKTGSLANGFTGIHRKLIFWYFSVFLLCRSR